MRYEYDTFGAVRNEVGSSGNVRKFTGKEYDADVKLYYYGARSYDPYLGRFISRDPAGQGLNWYVYANNNPLKFVDETGMFFSFNDIAKAVDRLLKEMGLRPLEPGDLVVGPTGGGLIVGGESGPALMDPEDPGEIVKAAQEAAIESVVDDLVTSGSEKDPTDPSTPVGRSGKPLIVSPGTNSPTTINGREYSGHTLDRMQERGIPPSVVENTIQHGQQLPGDKPGTNKHYDPVNNITVITNSDSGRVVTVRQGKP